MKKKSFFINADVVSDVGKKRSNNEDNLIFIDKTNVEMLNHFESHGKYNTRKLKIFGVFDGMGGHEFGEKASGIMSKVSLEKNIDINNIENELLDICVIGNKLVCEEMLKTRQRIGTTASLMALYKDSAFICNIGDSPILLIRDNKIIELYEEHTERKMYEKILGVQDSKRKYKLTQNIGIFKEEMLIKPYTKQLNIQEGDIFLLCSDGLTDMVDQKTTLSILDKSEKSKRIDLLLNAALNAGGIDNITIVLVEVEKKFLI